MKKLLLIGCFIGFQGFAPFATAETATFKFASVGTSFSAALPADSPLIGQEVVTARIYLDVESFPGSDAANFFTDISFPIEPFPGNESALVLVGADLGWSGAGTFHYFEETTRFNGIFGPFRYGGETPGENFNGIILDTSRIEFDYRPATGGELTLNSAASRITHGSAGDFDVNLPLSGDLGIECRTGAGPSSIVFTFNNNVTGAAGASATCGKLGNVSVDPSNAHNLLVRLNELVCDETVLTITLTGVTDDQGNTLDSASVTFGILFGDVTADKTVNFSDLGNVRAVLGQRTNSANFRTDLNADGRINNQDIGQAQRSRGDMLP